MFDRLAVFIGEATVSNTLLKCCFGFYICVHFKAALFGNICFSTLLSKTEIRKSLKLPKNDLNSAVWSDEGDEDFGGPAVRCNEVLGPYMLGSIT